MSPFEKIEHTARCLYGPRKLLLCGFPSQARSKFIDMLNTLDIDDLPMIWVASDQMDVHVTELLKLTHGAGIAKAAGVDRAIIVAGIAEKELHQLMGACRRSGMQDALWAALTPISEKWTISQLITELKAERQAMAQKKGAHQFKV